ncbi:MAG: leucine-rich repeat protein [Paludibacteraceae bacterium]|nr:leucine-rich repeat protein [Paludibacteraceae bacterium]
MKKVFTLLVAMSAFLAGMCATPIQIDGFYYEIKDYGYGAYAELVQLPGSADFTSYPNLSGDLTLPGSITYNGTVYPVTTIGYQAFTGTGITSVTVPEGVEYINNFAFMSCTSLTTATLPSTTTRLGNQVFGWSGLKTLTIYATTPPTHGSDEYGLKDANSIEHIYVPASSVAAYQADSVWSEHASIIEAIPDGTTTDPTGDPTTEDYTIVWDSISGLTGIDISQYTNYNFGGELDTFNDSNFVSREIDGITVSVSATTDGSYARVITDEGNTSISVSGGGKLTFFSPELPFKSIVIHFDPAQGVANVNSASEWSVVAGDTTSISVNQVVWSGAPTYSVVMEDAYVTNITSIVFTFAMEEETSSYISVAEALSIGYQLASDDSFAYSEDAYTIIGYASALVPASSNYDVNGSQTFWMADEQGSTASSNSEGAIRVYFGLPNQEVQVGDKVQVDGVIMKSTLSTGAVLINTKSYATVTVLESGSTTPDCSHTYIFSDTVCSNEEVFYMDDRVAYYSGRIDTTVYEGGYSVHRNEAYQTFIDTVRTADGCEDIYLHEIVWRSSKRSVSTYRIEEGESIYIGGRVVTESGVYHDSVKDVYGCDSTYEYNVIVYRMTYDTINAAICQGEVYQFRDKELSQSGVYRTTSAQGDTTFIIRLTVYPTQYTEEYWPIYEGRPVVIGDRRYEQPGRYDDTLKTIMGCDSIVRTYIENARYHIDLSSNNDTYGWVRGDTMVVWPDSTARIQAVAYDGYVFSKWSDGNTDNPRELAVSQDMAIMAIFKPFKYTITVVAEDPTMGTVMGGGTYSPNEQVTIMATPYKDCEFVQWSNGNKLNPLSFRAQGDSTYTAVFNRKVQPVPVICSDTMIFMAQDTTLLAIRAYAPEAIEPYDRFVIATIDNHAVMGNQDTYYRDTVAYTKGMSIDQVAVVTAVPHDSLFRLQVDSVFLTPGNEARNALYTDEVGADWTLTQYDKVIIPQTVHYDQRMLLYNENASRFSAYRQLTSIDRRQTTLFKLQAPRVVPVDPVVIVEDTTAWKEEEQVMDTIVAEVVPQDTVAVITTPVVDYVYSFTLIIWADEAHTQVLVIVTYDGEGNQISVTRPSAVRSRAPQAKDISFEIGGLEPSKTYPYTLVACEDDGSILTSLNSSFSTTSEQSGIQGVNGEQGEIVKFLRDGQLYILRGDKIYTVTGAQVK